MKNTLQFEKVSDNNATTYANENVMVYRYRDTVCNMDILHINTDLKEHKGVKITKTAEDIIIFPVNKHILFITGLDDCKNITVKSDGTINMTIEL